MNLTELLTNKAEKTARTSRINGVVAGLVTDNHDPEGRARVKVKFPSMAEQAESDWAKVVSPMAGKGRGMVLLPEPGDEVLVAFEHGDIEHPYVLGGLWSAEDPPPETNSDGKNNIRLIKSRSGHEITLDDSQGAEKVQIKDKSGSNVITIDSTKEEMTLVSKNKLTLKSGSNVITIDSTQGEISLSSQTKLTLKSQQVEIDAGATLKLSASGQVTINGATVSIN